MADEKTPRSDEDAEKLARLRKALAAKPVGYVGVTAGDLAVCASLAGGPADEIAQAFAKGAASVRPHQVVDVRADQLRAVLEQGEAGEEGDETDEGK